MYFKTNLEHIEDYLSTGSLEDTPKWLQFLAESENYLLNLEYFYSVDDWEPNDLVLYVHRTLKTLDQLNLEEEIAHLISTTLVYSETAKGGSYTQRKEWYKKGYNLKVHNEGSMSIFAENYEGNNKRLIYELIRVHGLIGQYLRGESILDSHLELILILKEKYSIEKSKELILYLNKCVISGVSDELWRRVEKDVEKVVHQIFEGDLVDSFDQRVHKLTASLKETKQEKKEIMMDRYDELETLFWNKEFWYVEAAIHDLNFKEVWTIFKLIYEKTKQFDYKHLQFEKMMKQLHYEYKGQTKSNIYKIRIVEKYLKEIDHYEDTGSAHLKFVCKLNKKANMVEVFFEFSPVGEALINFCVEAEKVDMMHNRAILMLFDLFGLRRDSYDRFNNEETYLNDMNSAAEDKRIILDYIKGQHILDIGPGGGILMDMIENEMPSLNITGIDISENVINELKKKKKDENRNWNVVSGNALNLTDNFPKSSFDTVIYSSIIHELFSYIEFQGKKFNEQVVSETLKSAYEVLKPGGRIIIRDGVKMENSKIKRIIRFKNPNDMIFLEEFIKLFPGRDIECEILSDSEAKLPINDAMEFYIHIPGEKKAFYMKHRNNSVYSSHHNISH
ncbi:SAM-dependent methyltransferases [Mesobacillus boroniphilus JCM 21738]|uniref:SAM-dependent methyltransferases n=1 Tax=Mesobacillus boroniphilus JCM 21738 TaxID=1294265 RepID=W4RSN5_9BACI|nr:class I SAM-dependent methyltransferase [Mesobacillus boroniphilus]GAE47321.1 SAM-dependent methyltransferases [Mesobacillus boroniphilus JCM 21738]